MYSAVSTTSIVTISHLMKRACDHMVNANERYARELPMVRREKGTKLQPTGPEPATSRVIADPLAAEPWSPPASIDPFPS